VKVRINKIDGNYPNVKERPSNKLNYCQMKVELIIKFDLQSSEKI